SERPAACWKTLCALPALAVLKMCAFPRLLFPNEEWGNTATDTQLDNNVSQVSDLQDKIQTLSTQNADRGGTTGGFLYVPDLEAHSECYNVSTAYVPTNATRQANLPPTDFTLIAVAPWINVECTREYMGAARQDPNRAFIFYLPDNDTTTPPSPSDPVWNLQDGGAWKTKTQYPVYTIPGYYGDRLMHALSLYSGNMTSVPYGHQISELPGIDPRSYVRLYTVIDNSNSSTLPQFWVFLLLVIAVLVVILGSTSAAMHLIQRWRRHSLRRRVASGEVNLEALGIKRLAVPHSLIDRLPLFIYNDENETSLPPSPLHKRSLTAATTERHLPTNFSAGTTSQSEFRDHGTAIPRELILVDGRASTPDSYFVHKFLPYSQPTCHICDDDFEVGVTEIRELPCGHIFHPDCIDTFLGSSSSLCPVCKQSALLPGYCPTKITNAMVRRERNLRRLRHRITLYDGSTRAESSTVWGRIKNINWKLENNPMSNQQSSQELSPMPEAQQVFITNALPTQPRASVLGQEIPHGPTRQEIVGQRIREIAASQTPIQDPDEASERQQRPKWKQTLSKAFPGFT
ncbi:Receptor homology region,transmembrane domain- and RING domain-containing protein, partial [Lachnellula hyalina]